MKSRVAAVFVNCNEQDWQDGGREEKSKMEAHSEYKK